MTTTGYADVFNRTVSGGLGVATSGQTYTLIGAASQFSVAPNTASVAISSSGDKMGYIDRRAADLDITGQVALSAIPATNLATVGFVAKFSSTSNYYVGSLMVQTLGLMSLRFSKVFSGGLSTLSTTLIGSYTAGAFYNLRYAIFWSQALQTNVMQLKAWLVGTAEPGGWQAVNFDSSITQYTSGTNVGLHCRDESTSVGSITARYQNVAARSYALPMPDAADPMCADPAVAYPDQTALQSLAVAADTVMATFDPLADLAALYPRVRVSATNTTISSAVVTYTTTEFNIGTPTNLGQDNTSLYLPVGIWLTTFEIEIAEGAATVSTIGIAMDGSTGPSAGWSNVDLKSSAVHQNSQGIGGCAHISTITYSIDPGNPVKMQIFFGGQGSVTYTIKYTALSAIKISDYFA